MNKVVSIYEAKTHLSKLIKKAQAGETIYIGAYGQPQVIMTHAPAVQKANIGVWKHKKLIDYDQLEESDEEIATWLEGGE